MRYLIVKHRPTYKVIIDSQSDKKRVVLATKDKDEAYIVLEQYLQDKKHYNVSLITESETRYMLDN